LFCASEFCFTNSLKLLFFNHHNENFHRKKEKKKEDREKETEFVKQNSEAQIER